jgi:hypothetical protein
VTGLELTDLARKILARAPRPIPRYGSTQWLALPVDDLSRFAAVLVAAECWRDHCSTERVAEYLREQMDREDRAVLRRIRGTSRDVQEALAQTLPGYANSPSYAELARRRAG